MKTKNTILAACSGVILAASLNSAPVMAEEKSYTAKEREDGKFCARVEVQVGMHTIKRTKCRTLKEWEEAGYVVSAKEEV
jgi:hypothetical protein